MDAGARFRRIEELFHRASELTAEERGRFLDLECPTDTELRRKVEAMLTMEETAEARIQGAIEVGLVAFRPPPAPPRIGPYRIIQEIGRGGFATVYLAERDDAQFSMQVAIKLVRGDLHSGDVARRLRRERQILAGLDHPNIARILDGGSTDDGTPYVVMEYIDGEPVDRFCDQVQLDLRQRLELFRQICDAVRYAHQNLVLHRDIKPSNILVAADGAVKLLDFGIAKLLHDGSSEQTAGPDLTGTLTRTGVRVLTPEYASPEQVEGLALTTATDVYALGVQLYRLVTGERPYQLRSERWSEIERVICEVTPEPPSAVLQQQAGPSGRLLRLWNHTQNRDLDTIVLSALRKKPERRYATAEQLSEDLRRYLDGLPILARRDTFGYRMGKFVARHRLAVGSATLVVLALLGATVFALRQAHRADRARLRAELQQERASRVAEFMEGLFETSDPYRPPGEPVTAREVLDRGSRNIRSGLEEEPEVRAALMGSMGRVYRKMDLYEEAAVLLEQALTLRRDAFGEQHLETAESWRDLGVLATELGDCEQAASALENALTIEQQVFQKENLSLAATLHHQGQLESECGDRRLAKEYLQRALTIRRRLLPEDSKQVIETQNSLANIAFQAGNYNRAKTIFEEILKHLRQSLGSEHPEVATAMGNLAAATSANGDPESALLLWERALELRRQTFGEYHGSVAASLYDIGIARKRLGELEEAETKLRQSLQVTTLVYAAATPQAANCHHQIGILRKSQGDPKGARKHFDQALEMRLALFGKDHPLIAQSLYSLAGLLVSNNPTKAEQLYQQSIEIQERATPGDFRISYPLIRLGDLLHRRGEPDAAEPLYRRALQLRRNNLPHDHWEIAMAQASLGQCLNDLDRTDEARELLESSLKNLLEGLGPDDKRTQQTAQQLEDIQGSE